MAGRGRAPKPANLRQRQNRRAGIAVLEIPQTVSSTPEIPNPDERTWHPLTLKAWEHAWASPMAAQWLQTDLDALGRLALLWDSFYKAPHRETIAEIRLQESRFGLSPLDRSRLQWEIKRAEEPDRRRASEPEKRKPVSDPRKLLMAVK